MEELQAYPYPLPKEAWRALEKIKNKDNSAISDLFKALADPARIKILQALGRRELCVCVLVELTGLQYSALSYHLKQLKDLDLVASDKDGNYLIYSLTPKGETLHRLIQRLDSADRGIEPFFRR